MKYLAAAIAVIAAIPGVAQAQTAYTNKAAFLAAAGSTQTETFSSAQAGRFASTAGVFNKTFDGFSVTGLDNGNFVGIAKGPTAVSGGTLFQNTPIPTAFVGQNYLSWADITGGVVALTINFNAATTAFGFDWFNTDTTDQYSINLPGGTVFSGPPFTYSNGTTASTGFFGLVSATPFTSVVITNGAGSVNGGVPEPASWAMMILGMGAIGFAMRATKRRSDVKFDMKIKRIAAGATA